MNWTCWFADCGSIDNNREALHNVPLVRRWTRGTHDMPDDFPYRSHGQPITAYLSLAACLFILVVANGASLWKEFNTAPFLSAYLEVSLNVHLTLLVLVLTSQPADLFRGPLGIAQSCEEGTVAACRPVEWRRAGEEDAQAT